MLVPLHSVSRVKGGVVTRANAYFIVRELPFDQVPRRFNLTRNDWHQVRVVMDGKSTPFRIELEYLHPLVKGPEMLRSPYEIEESDQRLFVVNESVDELRLKRANGALAYLRRGETVSYNVSEDSLKGGIPAKRSNIRIRKPYWYSLGIPPSAPRRIVVPEHIGRRYIASVLEQEEAVVIDKLYLVDPVNVEYVDVLLMSLNSALTWYQLELRGRTQLGQGVLEVKIPDWEGLLVLNPEKIHGDQLSELSAAFAPISTEQSIDSLESLADAARVTFEEIVMKLIGSSKPSRDRLTIERALRAAAAERSERRESVSEEKIARTKTIRGGANVDAYAARIAARISPFPDPRRFVPTGAMAATILVDGPLDGQITVGDDLFTSTQVFSGKRVVATADDPSGAVFIRGALLQDPDLKEISVPVGNVIENVIDEWRRECRDWHIKFEQAAEEVMKAITDIRLRGEIVERALTLLHAH
ncbi:hypothetical protein [Amycolatopsis eburnea]|uniref:Uncharacterized protein n=1 Tax=Amycolatopsis eburnea TaxID=2267691 RepID=A0A427T7F8_9PSEU|nr:hypothetical protein [Amycolatopsis eburnea]RSD16293.1 hypothetical protein EIY87_21765 [Amycolatopsis eburnea]